jgi:hypothetical protein
VISKFVDGNRIIGVLPRKPAYLTVRLTRPVEGAVIEVSELGDGAKATKTTPVKNGEQIAVPFDAAGDLRKRVQVSVYVGDNPVKRSEVVNIGPGEKQVATVRVE